MPVQTLRRRTRRPARVLAVLAVGGLLLVPAALPAAAKEFLNARLDAPISFDSPPGAELLVAVIVTVPEGLEDHLVDGSPVWLRLTGRGGDVTEAPGVMGTHPGRYEVRIKVPKGGPRGLEVFLRGAEDLPVFLEADPFTFRPMGPGTAQLAPARVTSKPVAGATEPAIAVAPAAKPAADPVAQPAAERAVAPSPAPWLAALLAVVAGAAVVGGLALAVRRSRAASPSPSRIDAPPRAPGA